MESKLKIVNLHRQGKGIRCISRNLNLARNTVREVIRTEGSQSVSYVRKKQAYPALGDYLKVLEELFQANKTAQPKRTLKQIFEELQQLGYTGSKSALERYAAKWRVMDQRVPTSACVPLSFSVGEAYQFDWSTDRVIINDEIVPVKVAHFVLCYSRKKFSYIYPNETQEMVFDAHIRAFEFFGGTPIRGIYDNMSTAVKKVLCGKEREWNANFARLCAHYRVEPTACTPARGNEKGRVERQVQIDRQQFFTPMPVGDSLKELNDKLISQLIHYNSTHKHPEYKERTLDEMFAREQHCLVRVSLPFDGYKETDVKVSTTCLVRYDRNNYSVHCSCSGQIVQCKSYADRLVFIHNGKEVGRHERRFGRGHTYYNWQHYLPILSRKPGALRNGAPFEDMVLPGELNEVCQHLAGQVNGARDFAHILSYIPIKSMESVVSACAEAINTQAISKDVILNILLRSSDMVDSMRQPSRVYLPLKHIPQANCQAYNTLLSGVSI